KQEFFLFYLKLYEEFSLYFYEFVICFLNYYTL
ncbi:hypothetical protein, partial [Campylobacter jejuni]